MRPLGIAELDQAQEPRLPLVCEGGEIHVVARPRGTRGYDGLRRRANREALGEGLRPAVADPADLVRMLEAHEIPVRDPHVLPTMRRLVELNCGRLTAAGSGPAPTANIGAKDLPSLTWRAVLA